MEFAFRKIIVVNLSLYNSFTLLTPVLTITWRVCRDLQIQERLNQSEPR